MKVTRVIFNYREAYPQIFKAFETAVEKWFEKRKRQGKEMNNGNHQDFLGEWYEGKARFYKKNKIEEGKGTYTNRDPGMTADPPKAHH